MILGFWQGKWWRLGEGRFVYSQDRLSDLFSIISRHPDEDFLVFISYGSSKTGLPYAGVWRVLEPVEVEDRPFDVWDLSLGLRFEDFRARLFGVKGFIREGYTYQVNLTFPIEFAFRGSVPGFFECLLSTQPTPLAWAIVEEGWALLSLSPERFLLREGRYVEMEPMKGTWAPDNPAILDEKTKAENVMIVDMVRNELGQICDYGSVKADLFLTKHLPTVSQLVSRVKGRLRRGVDWPDIFSATLPPASVTGAPKSSTVSIISQLENWERGPYTGVAGWIRGDQGELAVLIRTVELYDGLSRGRLGIGSGVVWDSRAHREYAEDLLKAGFFLKSAMGFELIETMRVEDGKIPYWRFHAKRLLDASSFFGFRCPYPKVKRAVERAILGLHGLWRLRLSLSVCGRFGLDLEQVPKERPARWKALLKRWELGYYGPHLRFKTTRFRPFFDSVLREARERGYDEVIFVDEDGFLLQGCITNVFVESAGEMITPPSDGRILEGVLRQALLEENRAREGRIHLSDLVGKRVFVGNALRGLIPVELEG